MGAQNAAAAAGCDGKQHGGGESRHNCFWRPLHHTSHHNRIICMHFTQRRRTPFPPRASLDFTSLEGSKQWMPLCLLKADNECSSSRREGRQREETVKI